MAKVLFIAINDFQAEGLRTLSACLKQKGHQSSIILFKKYQLFSVSNKEVQNYDWIGIDAKGRQFRFSRGPEPTSIENDLLLSLIKEIKPQLIGFSVVTPLRKRVAEITKLIKNNFTVPVIWGGPDPTISSEECLEFCDYVCIGEGEEAIAEIANSIDKNKNVKETNNLAYLENGKLIRNP